MSINKPESAASFSDASNEKPKPVNKKDETVKTQLISYKDMTNAALGKFKEMLKSKINMNPEVRVTGAHAQPFTAPNLGENRNMIFRPLTNLFEETEQYVLTESDRSFLEITSHKFNLDYDELQELFLEGVEYWASIEDERNPEDYGYYFVNEAVQDLMEKKKSRGMFDWRDETTKSSDDLNVAINKTMNKATLDKKKEEINKPRAIHGYAPQIVGDGDGEASFRYIAKIDEDPEDQEAFAAVHRVRAKNQSDAALKALEMHEVLAGKAAKHRDKWNVSVSIDNTPVTAAMSAAVASRKRKKPKKPTTRSGKRAHRKGQAELEASTAPRPKRKRGGSRGGVLRGFARLRKRKTDDTPQRIPASRQLTYEPKDDDSND